MAHPYFEFCLDLETLGQQGCLISSRSLTCAGAQISTPGKMSSWHRVQLALHVNSYPVPDFRPGLPALSLPRVFGALDQILPLHADSTVNTNVG